MRLKLFLAAIVLGLSLEAAAQDIIHTVEGIDFYAKVLEINDNDIVYKTFEYLDGPDYRISKSRVLSIDFENGTRQTFIEGPHLGLGPYEDYYYDDYIDYRWGGYYRRGRHLSRNDVQEYIGYSLYGSRYMKARDKYYWGMLLTVTGALAIATGISMQGVEDSFNNSMSNSSIPDMRPARISNAGYTAAYIGGAVCLGAGIPLWICGNKGLRKIADDYNSNYVRPRIEKRTNISLGQTAGGIGLALNF